MANYDYDQQQRYSSAYARDEYTRNELERIQKENSKLWQQLKQSRKNCSNLFQQLSITNINLKEKVEREAVLVNQAKEDSQEIARLKNLYTRAQAKLDLDSVNEKLAIAVANCNRKTEYCEKLESENTKVKEELNEKCVIIRSLKEKLKNEEEKWEVNISMLKYTHKIQVENYEQTISKNMMELEELRKLVRDSDNIVNKTDTKVLVFEAHSDHVHKCKDVIDDDVVKSQHKLIEKQTNYIKSLEGFLSVFGEATDENYELQKQIYAKDETLKKQLVQLQEARDIVDQLHKVVGKADAEILNQKQIYEMEKTKLEKDVQEVKAVLVEKNVQLESNVRERDQLLGFLETVKDMVQFPGDDNFPLINQLDGLKECINERMVALLQICTVVDNVKKTPTVTATTTTTKKTLKTVKQRISKKMKISPPRHGEDLSRRVQGRGPENLGGKYFCLCNKFKASSKELLQNHIKHASQEHKFKCDKCSKRYMFVGQLEQHLSSAHGIHFEGARGCRSCGILFKSREEKASHTMCSDNSEINLQNCELPMETEASNPTDDELRVPAAPPAPPTSTVMNRNRYSDEKQESSRRNGAVGGEKEQRHTNTKKREPSPVQNSSSSEPPPKRRLVSTDSDEDGEVDIEN